MLSDIWPILLLLPTWSLPSLLFCRMCFINLIRGWNYITIFWLNIEGFYQILFYYKPFPSFLYLFFSTSAFCLFVSLGRSPLYHFFVVVRMHCVDLHFWCFASHIWACAADCMCIEICALTLPMQTNKEGDCRKSYLPMICNVMLHMRLLPFLLLLFLLLFSFLFPIRKHNQRPSNYPGPRQNQHCLITMKILYLYSILKRLSCILFVVSSFARSEVEIMCACACACMTTINFYCQLLGHHHIVRGACSCVCDFWWNAINSPLFWPSQKFVTNALHFRHEQMPTYPALKLIPACMWTNQKNWL